MPILEEAARQFGAQIGFEHHAFELRPDPVPLLDPKGKYIQEHWRNRVLPMSAERGLTMRIPRLQTRTRRAHEAAAFAKQHGRFEAVDRGLFRAFFEHGLDIDDADVLAAIAVEAGLDGEALRRALDARDHAPAVDADVALAARLAIRAVPTMLVADASGRAEPLVGAVPYGDVAAAVQRAAARTPESTG